jgi:radical SAM superfamily enzyme YgiQ (UPF0313 family)
MLLNYEQPLYRPPSEANNLILQVTIGCRFNQCSFCSMYKSKEYRLKSDEEIQRDITRAATQWPDAERVFLADGDAFNLSAETLLKILSWLQHAFVKLRRVSCYATPANILAKTTEELSQLKKKKLSLLYVGVESGNDTILKSISKGASQQSISRALLLADLANIKISATIILGLGGRRLWQQHITDTIHLLNSAPVTYLSTLQLYLEPDIKSAFYARFSESFIHQNDSEILNELHQLIKELAPPQPLIFRSNHASNALPLAGNLPKDKLRLLEEVELAMQDIEKLRPADTRSL